MENGLTSNRPGFFFFASHYNFKTAPDTATKITQNYTTTWEISAVWLA